MAEQGTEMHGDLAGEYVLGTLRGKARLQFELLLQDDSSMRKRVHEWEERLFCLTDGITHIKPNARVWKGIDKRINPNSAGSGLWDRLGWWRGLGMATTMMLLVVSVYLLQLQDQPVPAVPTIAVLSDQSSQAAWVVKADYSQLKVTAQALKVKDPGSDKSYELWMLPDGGQPKSLGLMPLVGKLSLNLTVEKLAVLKRSGALAVSLEPAGGSTTGLPTGPVLFQGKILQI